MPVCERATPNERGSVVHVEHPEFIRVRRAVRGALADFAQRGVESAPLVLVALSGGADSLALAAATAAEATKLGVRAGAVVVDHGLQAGSAEVAERAAEQARGLGLCPVVVSRVEVSGEGGPEAAARDARYEALDAAAARADAVAVLTAHTRDDQAEQVLLALTRGSGSRAIAGIPAARSLPSGVTLVRPLIGDDPEIFRATTVAACAELELEAWSDPHNRDRSYARVRVRETVLPILTSELGPGIAAGLARSADLAREDADALDAWAERIARELVHTGKRASDEAQHIDLLEVGAQAIATLAEVPAAVRQRVIHRLAREISGSSLSRAHVIEIARLVTHWRGQGPINAPGLRVTRTSGASGVLRFEPFAASPRRARISPLTS